MSEIANQQLENSEKMSDYFQSLSSSVRMRYQNKILCIKNIDPYLLKSNSSFFIENKYLPKVTDMDIVGYFLSTHSFFTAEKLKSYKNLDSYKYCEAGFVRDVLSYNIGEYFVVVAKVKHSQRANASPALPWIILRGDGSIQTAHCNCMAGLGEVCSHAAAVTFYLAQLNHKEDLACTSMLSQWTVPKNLRDAGPVRIKHIDFGKQIKSREYIDAVNIKIPALEGDRLHRFLEELEEADPEAVILSVTDPFAAKRAEILPKNLPKLLTDFFNLDYCNLSLEDLRKIHLDLSITPEQQKSIEKLTLKQSSSLNWYNYRGGRITASKFKSACATSISKPSVSLIKMICYPSKVIFHSKEVNYGIAHEKEAIKAYEKSMIDVHQNFILSDVGFLISQATPQVGASPDALISCDCCGLGCLEIKCPWRSRDGKIGIQELSDFKNSFIKRDADGKFHLCPKHSYYYQVQLQMYVLNTSFCDFVVWSKFFMFKERILFNAEFMKENLQKALELHDKVIKPELLAKFYTEPVQYNEEEFICICKNNRKDDELIYCCSESCEMKLFHIGCVNALNLVDGDWLCENCTPNENESTNM